MTDPSADTPPSRRPRWWLMLLILLGVWLGVAYVRSLWDRRDRQQADQTYERALQLAGAGDYPQAQALLAGVLERYPQHNRARILNGQMFWEQRDAEQARAEWDRVGNSAGRDSALTRYLEGSAWLDDHRTIPAENKLRYAAELDRQYLPPLEKLVELYALQLRSAELRRTLVQIRGVRPLTIVELARGILADTATGDPSGTLKRLQQCYGADPEDTASRVAAARIQIAQADYEGALATLEQATRPSDSDVLSARALVMVRLDRLAEARGLISRLAGQTPSLLLWRARGELLEKLGQRPASIAALLMTARMSPFDVGLFHQLGLGLSREREGEELARAFLERAGLLDVLERDCFLMLRSANRPPQLVGSTALDIVEHLLALNHGAFAREWLQQARLLVPDDPRVAALAAQVTSAEHDTWEELLTRAAERYPQRLAERARLEGPPGGLPSGDATSAAPAPRPAPADVPPPDPAVLRLSDVAGEVGLDFTYENGGVGFKWIIESIGGGVAVLDYDSDGRPDLFFPQGRPLRADADTAPVRDRLYRNCGDGRFRDVTRQAGLLSDDYSVGAAVGDVDNDGLPDLFVNNLGPNVMYLNRGDGSFRAVEIAESQSGSASEDAGSSAAFADFDADGYVDLYVVNYVDNWDKVCANSLGEYSTCVPHQLDARQDRLLRNLGDGRFEDVTSTSGIVQPDGRGLGILAADFDGDARIDVYVANDGSPNFLFHNRSVPGEIRFDEQGLLSGVAVGGNGRAEAGMGIAAGDLNLDGRLDLFVTNFYQEPNRLYVSEADLLFRDATADALLLGPSLPWLGFGTQAVDLDLDGDVDLVVANGDIDDYSRFGRPWKMPAQVFANDAGRFRDVSIEAGAYFTQASLGRGVAVLDFNGDGRPDVVVVHQDRPAVLLRNDSTAPPGVRLRLIGSEGNRDAIGAQVTLQQQNRQQTSWLNGGDGFCASNERRLLFAVDPDAPIESIQVRWPSGKQSEYRDVPPERSLTLLESTPDRILSDPPR